MFADLQARENGFSLFNMKKILLFAALFAALGAAAQPTITGNSKIVFEENNDAWKADVNALAAYLAAGGGTVTTVSVVSANGFAGTVANATTTPAITLTTSITGMLKGNGTAISAGTAGTDYSAGTSALATGILKSTTTTGALTIAVAGDFPTLNQNTTGSAATLTTSRNIYGNAFNGSADVTGIIGSEFGGTENGFTKFTGPAATEKTFTLPNASATILTDNAAVTVAQGGTGATTLTGVLIGNGTSAFTAATSSTVGQVLRVTGANTYALGALDLADGDAVTGTLPVGNGGTGLTAVGGDVTLLGSNGTANIYYTPAITNTSAAIAYSRSSSTMNLNIPDADASFRGTVSTGTQTFAGAKTFAGAVTVSGLLTGSAGIVGTAGASVAAINVVGVQDGSYTAITANTTMDHTHNFVGIGTLSGDITVSLPACNSTTDGWEYRFEKLGTDAFGVILDPNSTEQFFDNATTKTFYSQGMTAWCKCVSATTKWLYSR